MKNLVLFYEPDLQAALEDIPVPEYDDNEVLIKVVAAGSNPKDWKHPGPAYFDNRLNQGDDVGGMVEAVGKNVKNFKKGDRVAGFHVMDTPRGTYAEYSVCPEHTVFHIPDSMSHEEAATIPLAAYTAAVGLFRSLDLPMPTGRKDEAAGLLKVPLIVNGAASAVGAYAVKLAKLNPRIYPIIGLAGGSAKYAKEIGCDFVVDYRSADVTGDLRKALNGQSVRHVFDATNTITSMKNILPVVEGSTGRYIITEVVRDEEKALFTKYNVWGEQVWVGGVHDDKPVGGQMFGAIMSRIFEWSLAQGTFSGQPHTLVEGGLNGVLGALIQLRDRKGGNTKFVTRIADTKEF